MKWISHKLTTLAATQTVGFPLWASLTATCSSVLPDLVEMGPGKLVFRKHRGVSHNFLFWFLVHLAAYFLLKGYLQKIFPTLPVLLELKPETLLMAVGSGVFLHLLTDSLSDSGIPLWGRRRLAFRLYRTSGFLELVLVISICFLWAVLGVLRRILP